MKKALLILFSFFSFKSYGIVDYSESIDLPKEENTPKSIQKLPSAASSKGVTGRTLAWKADYSFTSNYESLEVEGNKIGMVNLGAHVQTQANIFFDASYWHAKEQKGVSSVGNPKFILGFNWLRFGTPQDEARFDLYGGIKLPTKSKLGSSRTDKLVGVETTKRFGTFGLGIGYEATLVGSPKNEKENALGNVGRFAVSGGWMVSNDIQFEIEAENFSIDKSSDSGRIHKITKKITFSTLSPKLNLGLTPAVNLEIGARFRMKRAKKEETFFETKIFDLHGANSNSLFAGLNVTL